MYSLVSDSRTRSTLSTHGWIYKGMSQCHQPDTKIDLHVSGAPFVCILQYTTSLNSCVHLWISVHWWSCMRTLLLVPSFAVFSWLDQMSPVPKYSPHPRINHWRSPNWDMSPWHNLSIHSFLTRRCIGLVGGNTTLKRSNMCTWVSKREDDKIRSTYTRFCHSHLQV